MSKVEFADGAAFSDFPHVDSDDNVVLAYLVLSPQGPAFLWLPALFQAPGALTPELRRRLVAMLRHHADRVESGDTDKRIRELMPDKGGQS